MYTISKILDQLVLASWFAIHKQTKLIDDEEVEVHDKEHTEGEKPNNEEKATDENHKETNNKKPTDEEKAIHNEQLDEEQVDDVYRRIDEKPINDSRPRIQSKGGSPMERGTS